MTPRHDSPNLLPGEKLVSTGLTDLRRGIESIEALLVAIGAPRLRRLGLTVGDDWISASDRTPEHRLYELLEKLAGPGHAGAHSQYNAYIRRLVSYERALELRQAVARRRCSAADGEGR